jgi:PAS domain-containing protein
MRWKFAFGLASDDLFFVTTRRSQSPPAGVPLRSKVTTFLDEDEFLGHLIRAGLREDQTTRLARAVLLSVAKPVSPPPWIELDVTHRQMELLQLSGASPGEEDGQVPQGKGLYLQAARAGSLPQFYDLLMQAPAAISMLIGPDHCYSFINKRYAELIGIRSIAGALGTSALDKYPDRDRQRFASVLNRVYQTGAPFEAAETRCQFFHEASGSFAERVFNTVFQPICNAFGEVAGILVETADVTEMVLAREVREHREQLLYRQWAELDTIYRNAPIGLLLLDTKDFRILRLNERQAEIIGGTMAGLLGVPVLATAYNVPGARELFERVRAGESVSGQLFEGRLMSSPEVLRQWLVSVAPSYSPSGKVATIMLVSQEISREESLRYASRLAPTSSTTSWAFGP